jgi:hypothetical protein
MTDGELAICESWRVAAKELGIVFTSPFTALTSAGRQDFLGLIHGFGRKTGTLICLRGREPKGWQLIDSSQFFVSALTDIYAYYERTLFVDTMNDWQWCGEGKPPSWYSGQSWT